MIISHFSDTHGLPRKAVHDTAEVVVLSGDFMPNRTRGHRDIEPAYQREWIGKVAGQLAPWLGGRPLVFVEGNHDFIDPCPILRRAGINARNVAEEGIVRIGGLTFAGIPDIPWMGNEWAHEEQESEIAHHFAAVMDLRPDIVVNHCPPHGCLDDVLHVSFSGRRHHHIGSTAIANALTFGDHEPLAYLCGHCHEDGGKEAWIRNTIISNAATTSRLVTVNPRSAQESSSHVA